MKIDLNCPVEVWRCQLPGTAEEPCEITLYNLGDKPAISVEVMLIFVDGSGREIQRLVERRHEVTGAPGQSFSMQMAIPEDMLKLHPDRVEVSVEKIWFSDGLVWRRVRANMTEYKTNALRRGRALNTLRYIAGEDAIGYPVLEETHWMCVCGRPNRLDTDACARCGRVRSDVFANFNRQAVELAMSRQEARLAEVTAGAERLGSGDEDDHIVRPKHIGRRIMIALAVLALLSAGAYAGYRFLLKPYLTYRQAADFQQRGRYDEAIAAYESIAGYQDADEKLLTARYDRANALLARGDYDAAVEAFEALNAPDKENRVKEVRYRQAAALLGDGHMSEARAIFESLGDYRPSSEEPDSRAMVKQCDRQRADALYEGGNWEEAYAAYRELSDDAYAAERLLLCFYTPGKTALEAGDPDEALKWLTRPELAGYADTGELISRAYYDKAVILLAEGETTQAGLAFAEAGDYLDAEEQARACIYTPALEKAEAGEWAEAATLFSELPGYEDADDQWRRCVLSAARELMDAGSWNEAAEFLASLPAEDEEAAEMRLICIYSDACERQARGEYGQALLKLGQLPEDYEDTAERRLACAYGEARAMSSRGEYGNAAQVFDELGDYLDSAARANDARYSDAAASFAAGDWETAYELFDALGDYRNARAEALRARYRQAQALYTLGDTDSLTQAERIYEELGDYEQSAEMLQLTRYAVGVQLLEAGRYKEARERFEKLGDYNDSAERIKACDYAAAEADLKAGSKRTAMESFDNLGDYADAADRAKALRYELAGEALAAGNLTEAAALYGQLGDYRDSAERLEDIRHQVYGGPAELAQAALDAGNYAAAAWILDAMVQKGVPESYAFLRDIHRTACLQEGLRLMAMGGEEDREAAYPYLQRCADDPDAAAQLKMKTLWRMLGTWKDDGGNHTLILRKDGTMTEDGEAHTYEVSGYSLLIDGQESYKLVRIDDDDPTAVVMVLRDVRNGSNLVLTLKRTATDGLQPLPEVSFATMTDLPA
ncbi:MAG: hypothetical protein IK127_05235 [Clostridia bacterium]|nr:hypothetical protein [Clostridia bacterium]